MHYFPLFLHFVFSLLKTVLLSAHQIQEMFSSILLNAIHCHYQLLGRLQRMDKGVSAAFRLSQCQKPLAIESEPGELEEERTPQTMEVIPELTTVEKVHTKRALLPSIKELY